MLISGRILGLDIEEHAILAVQLRSDGDRYELRRVAEFIFPEDVSFDEPDKLGQLLRRFLSKNRFSAKGAILGIPVKWLIMKEEIIPPASADSLASILRIKTEREFSLDYNDLVFDYIGQASPVDESSLFLVATLRRKIKQVVETAEAAGLSVLSITSSLLTIALASSRINSATCYGLYIRPKYAEFMIRKDSTFSLIRHLQTDFTDHLDVKDRLIALAEEVQRLISVLPGTESNIEKLFIWNAANIDAEALQTFTQYFSQQVEVIDSYGSFNIKGLEKSGVIEGGRFTAPISLALAAKKQKLLAIDFLNSRISTKKKMADGRRILRAAVVGLAVILFGLFIILDWHGETREIATLRMNLENMKQDIAEAKGVVNRVSLARGWYSGRPQFLNCLRELTLNFPFEPRIWVTSLAVREDMQANVSGKSLDEKSVLELLDSLNASIFFSDVKMLYMRNVGRESREVSFAISFIFIGGK